MSYRLKVTDSFYNTKPLSTQLIKFGKTKYHCHDFIEFLYVIDGRAIQHLNGKKSSIQRGDAFLMLPDDNHSFEKGDEAFLHRDIMMKMEFFEALCSKYSPMLYEEILSRKYPSSFLMDNYLETRLEKLAENFEMHINKPTGLLEMQIGFEILGAILFSNDSKNENNNLVARLVKVLSSPDYFKYSVNEILEMENFGYCHEYICRLFKKKSGTTMTNFFNTNKIEYALTLKQTGFYTVSEIREIVHIENESYFYKLLKKHSKSN